MPALPALNQELDFARDLALRVGAEALKLQLRGADALEVREKPDDGGTVTKADLDANEAIVRALSDRFPHDGILAEESVNDAGQRSRERVWMIDPIDGTREFSQGLPSWAVHIGLTIGGKLALGVLARPPQQQVLWGVVGEPSAWTLTAGEGPRALRAPNSSHANPRVVASANRYSARVEALSDQLGIDETRRLRMGSTGVKMSKLSLGEAELYAHGSGGLRLWDTCAPAAVLEAAGGTVSDLRGDPLDHGSSAQRQRYGLLATRGIDHAQVLDAVRRVHEGWFDEDGLTRE